MKQITITFLLLSCFSYVFAQDFPGYRTSNYAGVNAVFSNPARIVGSPYRFDINLVTIHALAGNDQASFKLNDLGSSFSGDSFSDQIFGKDAGNANGLANIAVGLPSFMFNVGSKMSLAVTTRARVLANINDMNGKLVKKITDDFENDPDLPYTIQSADNMIVNISGWMEFGVAVGREIYNKGGNKINGGITVKYLSGSANTHLNIGNLNGTLNEDIALEDAYLSNTTGSLALGISGINFSDFNAGDLTKSNGTGVGTDIGFVYEWSKGEEDLPGYKLKIGLALLDIGKINFKRDIQRSGAYTIGITGAERYYFSNLDDVELDSYKQKFNSQPQYFTPVAGSTEGSYDVSLPTTLQLDADYRVGKRLYINAAGQFALSNNDTQIYNGQYYNSFTITPRLEGKTFGIFLPINNNQLTETNIGAGIRMGPLTIGSGSVLSALTGSSKQADLYFGLHLGLFKK